MQLKQNSSIIIQIISCTFINLRNKSWNPECVGNFNMDWRILVFYPEPEARDKMYYDIYDLFRF